MFLIPVRHHHPLRLVLARLHPPAISHITLRHHHTLLLVLSRLHPQHQSHRFSYPDSNLRRTQQHPPATSHITLRHHHTLPLVLSRLHPQHQSHRFSYPDSNLKRTQHRGPHHTFLGHIYTSPTLLSIGTGLLLRQSPSTLDLTTPVRFEVQTQPLPMIGK